MLKIGFKGYDDSKKDFVTGYNDLVKLLIKYLDKTEYEIINDYTLFNDLDLIIGAPLKRINPYRSKCKLTMWETNKLSHIQVFDCNKHDVLFLPSSWCKDVFRSNRIRTNIELFDAFISEKYVYTDFIKKDKLIIGLAFTGISAGRTDINMIINCFKKAFDGKNDVELWIKSVDINDEYETTNIKIFNKYVSEEDLLTWYKNIDVFLCGSSGEGIGLMNLQAMMCGRPIISHTFSTMNEYVNEQNSFIYEYNLTTPKDVFYAGYGMWAKINSESLIETLRYIYNNRDKIYEKSKIASQSVIRYKENVSVPIFIKKLKNYVY